MKNQTRRLVYISFLVTIACILYAIEIPLPGIPFKMDLSDLPILIGANLFGFGAGVLIDFLKNIIHALFLSKDANIIGEITNFVFGLVILSSYTLLQKRVKWYFNIIISVIVTAFIMHWFNYFASFPIYGITENKETMLLTMFLPLNLIKGVILLGVYQLIIPFIDKYFKK